MNQFQTRTNAFNINQSYELYERLIISMYKQLINVTVYILYFFEIKKYQQQNFSCCAL